MDQIQLAEGEMEEVGVSTTTFHPLTSTINHHENRQQGLLREMVKAWETSNGDLVSGQVQVQVPPQDTPLVTGLGTRVAKVGLVVALQLPQQDNVTVMTQVQVLIHLLDMKVQALGLPAIDELASSCPCRLAN